MSQEASGGVRFEEFVRDYGDRAYTFALRLCGDAEEARDLVQESFYRVLRHWGEADAARGLDAWYFRILRNLFYDARRGFERRKLDSLDAVPPGERGESYAELLPDREGAVLEVLERRSRQDAVHAALAALSLEHRAVLTLCDIEGRSYDDIAAALGLPLGTVRSRVSRARLAFRRALSAALEERP